MSEMDGAGRPRRRGPNWLFYGIAAGWTVLVIVVAVLVVRTGDGTGGVGPSANVVIPSPTADVELQTKSSPSPSPQPLVQKQRQGDPVRAWCWGSREAAETVKCQEEVAKTTKFVDRYQTHQKDLAAKHTIVKAGPAGTREANSLSRHGLLICWMTEQEKVSLDQMVQAFTFAMHPHQYTLPDPSGGRLSEAEVQYLAATQIHGDALQTICPSRIKKYQDKGGPIIAELAE